MIEILPKAYVLDIDNIDEELVLAKSTNVIEFSSYIDSLIGLERLSFLSLNLKSYYWKVEKFLPNEEYINIIDDVRGRPSSVSFKLYINDNYEGGELYFNNYKHIVKPRPGMLLVHPSSYLYRYNIAPIKNAPQIILTNHFYHANSKES